jgi:REP element-mobilizing transposase RayT
MARPLRIEYPGAFYHITARGNEGKEIFKSTRDRQKFLFYLESATQRYQAIIHVYCLMGNHYHLLLETPSANLSQILQHINGAYTTYFNIKRNRSGHLFQGRYKAILVEADTYATELSRYIHLNPVRAGLVTHPEQYPWSSYACYAGQQKKPDWLTVDFILGYFDKKPSCAHRRYREFVQTTVDQRSESPLRNTVASTILGNLDFVHTIQEKYLADRKPDRDLPALAELSKPSIPEILESVKAEWGEDPSLAQKVALYLCRQYSGRTLREIGNHFGIGESAVSQASRRFQLALDQNNQLRGKIRRFCQRLGLCNV